LGFINKSLASENLKGNDNPDPTIPQGNSDPIMDFNMNFGVHYKRPTWYVGASATNLLGSVRVSGDIGVLSSTPRQLYLSGGYIWNLETAIPWSIEPQAFIRTDFATWSLHLMALARYNGILWFGLSYQYDWGIAVLFGAVPFYNNPNNYLKGLEIGIAYSFQINKLAYRKEGSWGDFELVMRYGFNFFKEKALTGYGSSRHLYKNQY
jgi:type IX secretion system PorP/SprF family membrane protein